MTRTVLAVPAHRRRLVESAARSAADAVFLDLEDAVPEAEKAQALDAACAALRELDWGGKTVSVRVNAADGPLLNGEIARLGTLDRLDSLILPKAERVAEVARLGQALREVGRARNRGPLELELLIETALGLVSVETLAQADERVRALHLGVGDFAGSIGARSAEIGGSPAGYRQTTCEADGGYLDTPLDLFAYPMMRLLVCARAFGLRAIDGPCGAYRDERLTRGWAARAAAMGFDGKQVIHPSQIEATRDAFMPSADELAFARRVVNAMRDAQTEGKGAVSVDGKMIDYANVRMAERMLALAAHGAL
ncbi:HpcH/HpaI aldolase/citrate lyase family protein [Chitinasiproducens palmae]|uniref:HpcH/HpaI aldolase/citrate lyase family protein n=1 Tax=Chitinasiproducens palmae TaxID=1770053 RepID=UPI001F4438EE|nr:CoA ester lyase [Chitinasiproducens palmae]